MRSLALVWVERMKAKVSSELNSPPWLSVAPITKPNDESESQQRTEQPRPYGVADALEVGYPKGQAISGEEPSEQHSGHDSSGHEMKHEQRGSAAAGAPVAPYPPRST